MLVLLNALQAGNRSGTGRYTTQLARWLPEAAPDLDFALIWPQSVARPHLDGEAHEAFVPRDILGTPARLYYDQVGIRKDISRLRPNVVHYPANIGPLFEMRNAVLTVHDLSFFREPRWFRFDRALYYRLAVARSARCARLIIVDSQATAMDLCNYLSIEESRIEVIPLGVEDWFASADEARQQAARERYGLPESFLLYVGTLEPRKNLVRLIEAWSSVADELPYDLVLAGREGWKFGPIRAAAARSPHSARIHFPGYVDIADMPALMSAARAFVWPTLWEGFGLPPLEAMACGVPVLTSNTSSLPEAVGDASLLVDPYDIEAIAEGLKRISEDGTLRGALRAKGLERARRFTWRRTAELTADAYRKVLGL